MGPLALMAAVAAFSIFEYGSAAGVSVSVSHNATIGDNIDFTISGSNRTDIRRVSLFDNYGIEQMEKPLTVAFNANSIYETRYVIKSDAATVNSFDVTVTLMNVTACDDGEYYFKVKKISARSITDYDAYYVNVTVNGPPPEIVDTNDVLEYNEIGDILNFQCKLSAVSVAGLKWRKKNTANAIQQFETDERQGSVMSAKVPSLCVTKASLWLNVTISASSALKEFYYECGTPDGEHAKTRNIKVQAGSEASRHGAPSVFLTSVAICVVIKFVDLN